MLEQAKAKLQAEIAGSTNNAYVHYVAQFLLSHLEANPQDAGKIMAEGKTVAKSLDAMKQEAEKKKVGNVAMLTPDEGIAVVLKYFGIDGKPSIPSPVPVAPAAASAVPTTSGSDFSVSLEQFGL